MRDLWKTDTFRNGIRKNSYLTPGPNLSVTLVNAWIEALVTDEEKTEIPQTWCEARSVAPSFGPASVELIKSLKLRKIFTTYRGKHTEPSQDDLDLKFNIMESEDDDGQVAVYIPEDRSNALILFRFSTDGNEGFAEITVVEKEGGQLSGAFSKLIHDHPFDEKACVYTIVTSGNSYCLETVGIGGLPLIEDNYSEEVVEQYHIIADDLGSEEPLGRLSIIDGPPGTGKTYLVRGLINEIPECKFVIVPPHLVSHLGNPEFASFFLQERSNEDTKKKRPLVLILEDADECLAQRDGMNQSSISAVLNLTDGIIGSLIDFRIIATTNVKKIDIDDALTRAGRLSAAMTIGELKLDHAREIYMRLTGCSKEDAAKAIDKNCVLADVYAKAKGRKKAGAMKSKKSKPVGFTVR